jgi:hypothetical protein
MAAAEADSTVVEAGSTGVAVDSMVAGADFMEEVDSTVVAEHFMEEVASTVGEGSAVVAGFVVERAFAAGASAAALVATASAAVGAGVEAEVGVAEVGEDEVGVGTVGVGTVGVGAVGAGPTGTGIGPDTPIPTDTLTIIGGRQTTLTMNLTILTMSLTILLPLTRLRTTGTAILHRQTLRRGPTTGRQTTTGLQHPRQGIQERHRRTGLPARTV